MSDEKLIEEARAFNLRTTDHDRVPRIMAGPLIDRLCDALEAKDEALRLLEVFALSHFYRADYDPGGPLDGGVLPTNADLGAAWKLLGITEENYQERFNKIRAPYQKRCWRDSRRRHE